MTEKERENKPLIITGPEGKVLDLSYIDEKGFNKSIEQKNLWHRERTADRLIPYSDNSALIEITDHGHWYRAVLDLKREKRDKKSGAPNKNAPTAAAAGLQGDSVLERLYKVIEHRRESRSEGSYTTYLFNQGLEKIRKKLGEEAVELILAGDRGERVYETADLLYHLLVFLCESGIPLEEVFLELEKREKA